MSETTTTVRVRSSTRQALREIAAAQGTTTDAVITAGLLALERERLRRQFEEDARRLANDPADREEVAAAIRELLGE